MREKNIMERLDDLEREASVQTRYMQDFQKQLDELERVQNNLTKFYTKQETALADLETRQKHTETYVMFFENAIDRIKYIIEEPDRKKQREEIKKLADRIRQAKKEGKI